MRQPRPRTGLQTGDIVSAIDGVAVTELLERWSKYYAASNEPTRLRDIARSMTRGDCGAAALTVSAATSADAGAKTARTRAGIRSRARRAGLTQRSSGRNVSQAVAGGRLSETLVRARRRRLPSTSNRPPARRASIIDIRNYPSEFVVFALGSRLVDRADRVRALHEGPRRSPRVLRNSVPPAAEIERLAKQ